MLGKVQKMTQRYTIQFMIRISEELRERLEQDAVVKDRSLAYIAREILENRYDISSKKKIDK
jgi:predicted DNA-binding protein